MVHANEQPSPRCASPAMDGRCPGAGRPSEVLEVCRVGMVLSGTYVQVCMISEQADQLPQWVGVAAWNRVRVFDDGRRPCRPRGGV